jgi:hypothetical protein
MNSGTIAYNYGYYSGVAVQNNSTFTMTGGSIANNDSYSSGGGVRVMDGSAFTMTGGTISDNTSETGTGGGVFIQSTTGVNSSFTMSGGTISGNKAPRSGGGVEVAEAGNFTLDGGTISDNITNEYGGGVNIGGTGGVSFIMRNGIITRNTARSGGGGVSVLISGGVLKKEPLVSGGPSGIIYGNDGGDNSNTAKLAETYLQGQGHAVYVANGPKMRETTVTAYQSLDNAAEGEAGGWVEYTLPSFL